MGGGKDGIDDGLNMNAETSFRPPIGKKLTDEQKQQRLISAREYVRHCLRLNAPDDLRVDVLASILSWAEYWKIHDHVKWVKQQWAKLRLDY